MRRCTRSLMVTTPAASARLRRCRLPSPGTRIGCVSANGRLLPIARLNSDTRDRNPPPGISLSGSTIRKKRPKWPASSITVALPARIPSSCTSTASPLPRCAPDVEPATPAEPGVVRSDDCHAVLPANFDRLVDRGDRDDIGDVIAAVDDCGRVVLSHDADLAGRWLFPELLHDREHARQAG